MFVPPNQESLHAGSQEKSPLLRAARRPTTPVSSPAPSCSPGEQSMSDNIENLLLRNLHEVFGERDPGAARDSDRGDIRSRLALLRSARQACRASSVERCG